MTASHSETPSTKGDASTFICDHRQVDRSKLSQMYLHYVETKDKYPHAMLLYRVGDFFECYFQDAVKLAQELELALTSKQAGEQGRVAMSGVPHHAWERYATMLVEKGYAVVICDQVEDAAEATGRLVRREVTRILTPGTLLEEGMLKSSRNNYLAAVVIAANHWGLAYADISTGEFLTTQGSDLEHLTQELMRLQPSEVLVPTNAPDLGSLLRPGETSPYLPECLPPAFCYSLRSQLPFSQGEARPRLLQKFKLRSLEGLGCDRLPLAVRAAGGLLEYLEDTQKENPVSLQRLRTYTVTDYLIVDNQTRRNLEITQTVRDGTYHGSLLWALDRTSTSMGGRALRRWLLQPLIDIKGIQARQDTIEELMENTPLRQDLRQLLRQIYDLERLTGRAGSGTANARDLAALADSLSRLPELSHLVADARSPFLKALQKVPSILEELAQKLHAHLVESPPIHIKEGGLIRHGVNSLLDDRKATVQADQQWIANLEVDERARTGIPTLKVGFNKTFGYYISISRAKADQVPANYIRKQTLTNEERYITPDLKEREARILTAREDLNQLEYEIFTALREEAAEQAEVIRNLSRAVAAADVLCGLAELAVQQGYCRPEMVSGREINVVDGRHPVVEQSLPAGFFVPNSTQLGREDDAQSGRHKEKSERRLLAIGTSGDTESENVTASPRPFVTASSSPTPDLIILTGPNASGKSCYLRQVGLIQLMAQIGSFVPAKFAKLGICDRIFTRVGAVDDLATGQSTFMVEMNETANILNHATSRSLVLLDEIGRGTATFDGLSIAWAVAEYIAVEIRARTIFATHYHELNELASILPNVANYQVTVKELPDQIIFLHQVQPGGADKSYGIEAGRLAGLPGVVIQRAKQVMGQIEKHSKIAIGLQNLDAD
ncbi:DNA mismatch repair protein MutS [Nostoc linckia z18]|uniref:DNA mismatch repair protein MutS n=2 Tax=Nostoc linckia TaxID=92942 RepID=A0A9Q5Z9J8_NOSLI|nr:DNA mismatch repair protein MutS [Nostoc linckia]PHK33943.1 DNA mismatch repair protein MutS [Nostoc linckia z15]PHK44358.1 DNA mismatch repair protein MutS [Nostoc linckia z16]PHJ61214.1 DNA mismatch repair protein MutS [Nostoc linckia z3]PHJ65299.1 DNA mismatch repair protein MutS [Nostoc linckia z1]PHJ75266.1 DNA mismatch repair protein MutS [Nostoc linckia z2]